MSALRFPLMYDGSAAFDLPDAIYLGHALAAADYLWYEEPMREFSISAYKQLAQAVTVPLNVAETSDGSHMNTADYIVSGCATFVRTSWNFKGGITGALRVAHLADAFRLRAEVHGPGLIHQHLCMAINNNTYYESLVMSNPVVRESCVDEHGLVHAPTEPGLGFEAQWASGNGGSIGERVECNQPGTALEPSVAIVRGNRSNLRASHRRRRGRHALQRWRPARQLYPNSQGRNAMASVSFEHVSKRFNKVEVVHDITFTIRDQEFLVLVGPSGCGKSTCLRMIAGLEEASEGLITIGERVVNDLPPKDRDIAMVFQNYALYPHMNVYDNMAFGLKLRRTPKSEIRQRVQHCRRDSGAGAAAQAQAQRTFRRPAPARGAGPGDCARPAGLSDG